MLFLFDSINMMNANLLPETAKYYFWAWKKKADFLTVFLLSPDFSSIRKPPKCFSNPDVGMARSLRLPRTTAGEHKKFSKTNSKQMTVYKQWEWWHHSVIG